MTKIASILFLSLFLFAFQEKQNIFLSNAIETGIYSEAPLENIAAISKKGISVYNIEKGEIQFNIPIKSLKFKKSLMEEHFNENYMESDKYPFAKFKGKVNQAIDLSKNGEYPVTVSGDLDVHGVKKQRTINGTIKVNNGSISVFSKFDVLCKDHDIKIPQLVFQKIAETIQVTISGNYNPYKSSK
ncbi:MAG: YceI family protein [Sphingobacteriales bacterium]|nr:YceI family protein [Sphingobacteriales bacterium]